jgi:hypothetical protein
MQRTSAHLYFAFAADFAADFCCLALVLIICSSEQWTALHRAAYNDHPALCELLIAGKADVNVKNRCAFIF